MQACRECGAAEAPRRPTVLWWVPNVLAWAGLMIVGPVVAVMPPLNIVLMPVVVLAGASLVGFLAQKVAREPRCAACDRVFVPAASAEAPPMRAGRRAGPAHERPVEGALIGEAE